MSLTTQLNIDMNDSGVEERLQEMQRRIIAKLTEGYGYELQDDTLSVWILEIAVRKNTAKDAVKKDLIEFIDDNAEDFVTWLWEEAPKV